MSFRFFAIIIVLLSSSVFSSVQVLSDNSSGFSFEYFLDNEKIKTDSVDGKEITIVDFAESDEFASDKNGFKVPYKSFTIGVPQSGDAQVYVEPLETRVIKLSSPLSKEIDSLKVMRHKGVWATTEEYLTFRDLRALRFYLTPFSFNPKNMTITLLLKAKVTVEYPSSSRSRGVYLKKTGDYEQVLKRVVMNYESTQKFRKMPIRSTRSVSPLSTTDKMVSFTVSDGLSGLNETTDKENGFMKIMASDLSPIFGSSLSIDNIAVYAANYQELTLNVPHPNLIPTGVEEVALLRVDANDNNIFDGNDYLLFYVSSLSDWITTKDTVQVLKNNVLTDSVIHKLEFNLNRVAQDRTFWIKATGGTKNISDYNYSGGVSSDTSFSFLKRERFREVTKYLSTNNAKPDTEGGINWVWDRLTEGSRDFTVNLDLDYNNIMTSLPGYIQLGKGYSNSDTLNLKFGGAELSLIDKQNAVVTSWPNVSSSNRSVVDINLSSNTDKDRAFFELDYIDISYNAPLSMQHASKIRFMNDTLVGVKTYGLSNLTSGKTFVFRMENNGYDISLVDSITKTSSDGTSLYWTDSTGNGVQYYISKETSFLTFPTNYTIHNVSNKSLYEKSLLRGENINCDYLVITSDEFLSQSKELAAHKVKSNLFDNPAIVNVKDIYREFSGGSPDYSAIRNFISYIYNGGWSSFPDYVLLFGAGHYDYKNYSKKGGANYIPTCQYNQWCMEDYYSYLDHTDNVGAESNNPDIFLGRILAQTSSDASSVVSKIVEMEAEGADFSDWRNRLLLVADDDQTPHGYDNINHYRSSEYVASYSSIQRPSISLRKVYLFEYPWNDIGKKPGAFNALESEINNGVSCVNYFGHGSWEAWADENILNKDNAKSLNNVGRYPVFTAFSCRVGRFDKPDETSLAGDLVNQPNSGAIAFIASTRTAYAGQNTSMAKGFFWALYDKEEDLSIGQAYAASKLKKGIFTDLSSTVDEVGYNLRYYALIGDPSIRINRTTDSVNIDLVTEKKDTIQALETVTINGTIGQFDTANTTVNNSFGIEGADDAYAQIGFYFPVRDSVKRKDGGTHDVTYSLPGDYIRPDTIVPVKNGKFTASIMIPKRVPFNLEKPLLRIYAWNTKGTKSAQAIKDDFIYNGSKSGGVADNSGPSITIRPIRLDTSGAVSGKWNVPVGVGDTIVAALPMVLGIDLWDASGLQLTGSTPGEGLTIEVQGVSEQISIGNEFSMDPESNGTSGSAEYFIDSSGVTPGNYSLIVGAMDINGNISRKEVTLKVTNTEDFNLTNVYNFPNPANFGKSTRFYFDHNRMVEDVGQNIDATIRIYSLSGKLLKIFRHASNGEQWDLRDQLGRKLSPNVYLYTVSASMTMDTGYTEKKKNIKSDIKKLVIHPPK